MKSDGEMRDERLYWFSPNISARAKLIDNFPTFKSSALPSSEHRASLKCSLIETFLPQHVSWTGFFLLPPVCFNGNREKAMESFEINNFIVRANTNCVSILLKNFRFMPCVSRKKTRNLLEFQFFFPPANVGTFERTRKQKAGRQKTCQIYFLSVSQIISLMKAHRTEKLLIQESFMNTVVL